MFSLAIKRPYVNFPSDLEVDSNSVKTYKLSLSCLLGTAWPSTTMLYLFGEFDLQIFFHNRSRMFTSYPLLLTTFLTFPIHQTSLGCLLPSTLKVEEFITQRSVRGTLTFQPRQNLVNKPVSSQGRQNFSPKCVLG